MNKIIPSIKVPIIQKGIVSKVILSDELKDKKIIMFGVPGAFTPTCSEKHMPSYIKLHNEFIARGIDDIYCLSVNDAFVMNAWARDQKISKVKMLADGSSNFTQGMGMLVNKDHLGFGMRSWRYSMLVVNGEVVRVFEEPGKNNSGDDMDPFEVSDADTMINYLKRKR